MQPEPSHLVPTSSNSSTTRQAAANSLRDLVDAAEALVGSAEIGVVQERVRVAMLVAALRQTRGNLSHTAHLLGVKRQAVQHMLRRYDMAPWLLRLRDDAQASGES